MERIDYLQVCNKAAVFATIVRSMAISIAMVYWLEEALALIKQEKCQEAIILSQEEVALHEPDNTNALMIIEKPKFSLEKSSILQSFRKSQTYNFQWEEC